MTLLFPGSQAFGQTYNESGDAGSTTATAQIAGAVDFITGDLDGDGTDTDIYAVTLSAGDAVTISTCNSGGSTDIFDNQLVLLDGGGAARGSSDDSSRCPADSYSAELTHVVQTTGTYYIGICAYDCEFSGGILTSDGASGADGDTYTISISAAPSAADFAEVGDTGGDDAGAQDVTGATLVFGDLDTSPDDVDVYELRLFAGDVTFSLFNNGGGNSIGDSELFLYEASNTFPVEKNDDPDSGYDSELTYTVTTEGTFYIAVCAHDCEDPFDGGFPISNGVDAYEGATYLLSISGSALLPVELAGFTGLLDESDVVLRWETDSERNNAGFSIEQRYPGTDRFAEIGWREGHGTTRKSHVYEYRVRDVEPGLHSFRLRQVDFDGQSQYSSVVEVDVPVAGMAMLSRPYPNPARQTARMDLAVAESQHVTVSVYDALGRRAKVLLDRRVASGSSIPLQVNTESLPSGPYIVHAKGERFETTRSLMIVQ